jgi:hypothetical protein
MRSTQNSKTQEECQRIEEGCSRDIEKSSIGRDNTYQRNSPSNCGQTHNDSKLSALRDDKNKTADHIQIMLLRACRAERSLECHTVSRCLCSCIMGAGWCKWRYMTGPSVSRTEYTSWKAALCGLKGKSRALEGNKHLLGPESSVFHLRAHHGQPEPGPQTFSTV